MNPVHVAPIPGKRQSASEGVIRQLFCHDASALKPGRRDTLEEGKREWRDRRALVRRVAPGQVIPWDGQIILLKEGIHGKIVSPL